MICFDKNLSVDDLIKKYFCYNLITIDKIKPIIIKILEYVTVCSLVVKKTKILIINYYGTLFLFFF